ncbi:MAG: hypothetical protein PHS54_03490 [Clostridia bacterium]|nr:hypothetical protein [Clostridia bacterium]
MKKIFKFFAIPLLFILLISCTSLFSGCFGTNIYSTSDFYAYYETGEEPGSEDYELYEELENGAIYKYVAPEGEDMSMSFEILAENTYKFSMNHTETSDNMSMSVEYYLDGSFEKYENGYILSSGPESAKEYYYVEITESILVGFTSFYEAETIEEAREAVDAYIESGKRFVVYFGYNGGM